MYCPNCGIEIHTEGSFCAKCRKDIAYLTKAAEEKETVPKTVSISEENTETSVPDPSASPDLPAAEDQGTRPEKVAEKGYFCNYCGTFVYPQDHYCYNCGKKTRPAYYKETKSNKNLYIFAAAGMLILFLISYKIFS